jgi:hypothetical protein
MKRGNDRKKRFIQEINQDLFHREKNRFQENIKFSLEYFCNSQAAGQDFKDWTNHQLVKLMEKLKNYCGESVLHWTRMRIGGGKNHVLEIYEAFPNVSDFTHPPNVPQHVEWGRFRLEDDMRLIGFVLSHDTCKSYSLQRSTFYIVFLDQHHRFYRT